MHKPHLMSGGRYPVLRAMAILYVVGAAVAILAGIVGLFWSLLRAPGDASDRIVLGLGVLAATFFVVISMLAIAEIIKLFVDMEHHMRMSATHTPVAGIRADLPPTTPEARNANRLHELDEEPAEAALLRGH